VTSRTAPWASPAALARLAAVEAALPGDTAGALDAACAAARAHGRRLEDECLLLYAGTNVPSPLVAGLHEAALAAQPSMGYPGDKYQAGLEPIDEIEVAAASAVARVMGAEFAEVRPTSATLANLAV
jgi:glycine hydroxymethyltransferase